MVFLGAVDQGLQLAFAGLQIGFQGAVGLGVRFGHQARQAWAAEGAAVCLQVFAEVDVANALGVVEVRVVGVVAEAVVLVFGGVSFQGDLHALAGQFAEGQAAHAEEHFAQAVLGRLCFQLGAVVIGHTGLPLTGHVVEVGDQQGSGRFQVAGAAVAVAAGATVTLNEIAGRALTCTWVAAVEVLTPKQEFDGVVAGGDVGFGAAQFIQAGQQFRGDGAGIQLVFTDLDLRVGDDVGGGAGVAEGMRVVAGHVVDQAFIQGPGIELAFPVVDHAVAEAEHFTLHVRHASGQPGAAGGAEGGFARRGQQGVDGALQHFAGAGSIVEHRRGEGGVMGNHGLAGRRIERAGAAGYGRRSRWRSGFIFAAAGESDGESEQTGAGQGHTKHGEVLSGKKMTAAIVAETTT